MRAACRISVDGEAAVPPVPKTGVLVNREGPRPRGLVAGGVLQEFQKDGVNIMINPRIIECLLSLGITHYGVVPVEEIIFNEDFREMCATNQCGKYNTNWKCPPGVGAAATLIAQARSFKHGLVLQTVWPLEDQFDFDGMMCAGKQHNVLFKQALEQVTPLFVDPRFLALSAGACQVCANCTYATGAPCCLPEKAISSLEAYCIDVTRLIADSGLAYRNGANTVSYVGLILFIE